MLPNATTARRLRRLLAAAFLGFCAAAASADVPTTRDDLQLNARTVIAVVGFAMLGGVVSWIAKVRSGAIAVWSLMHLIGEVCTSAFAGFLAYLLCDAMGMSMKFTIFTVGVAGHMGPRAIAAFESFAERRWGVIPGQLPERNS